MNLTEVINAANNNSHVQKAAEFAAAHGGEFEFTFQSSAPDFFEIVGSSNDGDYFRIAQKGEYHYVSFGGDSAFAISGGQGTYEFVELNETIDQAIAMMISRSAHEPRL